MDRLRIPVLAALLAICAPPMFCAAATPANPTARPDAATSPTRTDPRVASLLDALEERYENVESISGTFVQVKHSEIFLEETVSEGEFWHVKPDRFRCDYRPPYESINLIVDNVAYLGLPAIKQVEKYVFDDLQEARRHVNQLLLGFGIAAADLQRSYEITLLEDAPLPDGATRDDIAVLHFLPRFVDDSGIDAIVVWLNRKSLEPVRLLLEEGEDETVITMRSLQLNQPIDPGRFEINFPRDWEVIDKL